MKRLRVDLLLGFAALSTCLLGCPGELADKSQYEGLPACRGEVDVERLFVERCGSSICHGGQSSAPAADLDLTSPNLASRLVGVASTECGGLVRIDAQDPDHSFLLSKLIDPPAGCGDRMPLVGLLSPNEIGCIRAWIHALAQQSRQDGGP